MTGRGGVWLPAAVRRAIGAHAREALPDECCGLLVGQGRRIDFAVRMRNVAASPTRYRLEDRGHIELRRWLRAFAPPLTIVGVYHSHPDGPTEPSATDRAEAHYAGWIHLIAGLAGGRVRLRAFRIVNGRSHRLRLASGAPPRG